MPRQGSCHTHVLGCWLKNCAPPRMHRQCAVCLCHEHDHGCIACPCGASAAPIGSPLFRPCNPLLLRLAWLGGAAAGFGARALCCAARQQGQRGRAGADGAAAGAGGGARRAGGVCGGGWGWGGRSRGGAAPLCSLTLRESLPVASGGIHITRCMQHARMHACTAVCVVRSCRPVHAMAVSGHQPVLLAAAGRPCLRTATRHTKAATQPLLLLLPPAAVAQGRAQTQGSLAVAHVPAGAGSRR